MANGKYADRAPDFALQEHSLLRTEIMAMMQVAGAVERNVIVSIGIVWGFLAVHPPATPPERFAWWLPIFFVLLGWIRILALNQEFRLLATYLRRTEMAFAEEGGVQGWETFLTGSRRSVFASGMLFFVLSFIVTLAVALYKYRG